MLTKRTTLMALTILAALSVEIGCGDGTHKQPARLNKSLKQTTATKPKFGPDGKPIVQSLNAATDANTKAIDTYVAQLDGKLITREDLVAADYSLTSVTSFIKYSSNGTDTAEAVHQDTLNINSSGNVSLAASGNTIPAGGTIPTFIESPATGREFVMPTKFSINTQGTWDNNIESVGSSNVDLINAVTAPGGKLAATDTLAQPKVGSPASVLRALTEGKFNSTNGAAAYQLTLDDTVVMSVTLEQNDATTVTALVDFEEKKMADVDATHTQSTSYHRSFYLRFTVAPHKGATAATPADIKIVPAAATAQPAAGDQSQAGQQQAQADLSGAPVANPPPTQLSNDGAPADPNAAIPAATQ